MGTLAKAHLLALGDSHLEGLKLAADLGILDVASSSFSIVPGATVVGLRNPNSCTNAINIFRDSLENQPIDSYVLIHLGEVDCGFVMWWRAEKHGEPIDMQFQESIVGYKEFLNELLAKGFSRLCIAGASLPTILDGIELGAVANKRSEIRVSLRERTELTLEYNRALKGLADKLGISYFDITDAILDRSSNLTHDFFRNADPYDHHLDKLKTVGIWASKCNAFVSGFLCHRHVTTRCSG